MRQESQPWPHGWRLGGLGKDEEDGQWRRLGTVPPSVRGVRAHASTHASTNRLASTVPRSFLG